MSRDFKQIRETLDIEIVLQYYGYVLAKNTGTNQLYRIYKPGTTTSAQRIVVMNQADQLFKGFVDLNDPTFKGDSIQFVHYMEQQDWRRTFQVIDSIIGKPNYPMLKKSLPALAEAPPNWYLEDEKIIQEELYDTYQIKVVTTLAQSHYLLKKRQLSPTTIINDQFLGQILQATTQRSTDHPQTYTNVAFPLVSQSGHMVSMDIRGDGFKAFPEGTKRDGLWISNQLIEITQDTHVGTPTTDAPLLPKGSRYYLTPFGIRLGGNMYSIAPSVYRFCELTSMVLAESPIDLLSYHQLYPPTAAENRLYVTPAGNPSKEQLKHVATLMGNHPDALIVLAHDSDLAGTRYAINMVGLDPGLAINWSVVYLERINDVAEKVAYNRFGIRYTSELATIVEQLVKTLLQNTHLSLYTQSDSSFEIHLPNQLDCLRWVLETVVDWKNKVVSQPRFSNALPLTNNSDYNDLLLTLAKQAKAE